MVPIPYVPRSIHRYLTPSLAVSYLSNVFLSIRGRSCELSCVSCVITTRLVVAQCAARVPSLSMPQFLADNVSQFVTQSDTSPLQPFRISFRISPSPLATDHANVTARNEDHLLWPPCQPKVAFFFPVSAKMSACHRFIWSH